MKIGLCTCDPPFTALRASAYRIEIVKTTFLAIINKNCICLKTVAAIDQRLAYLFISPLILAPLPDRIT